MLEEFEKAAERYLARQEGGEAPKLPNIHVFRRQEISEFEAIIYNPVICLILRGRKETVVGTQTASVQRGDALLVSHDLPVSSKITQASPKSPYLALILALDLNIVRNLYGEVGDAVSETTDARSLSISNAQAAWAEPLMRYLALMDQPLAAKVLGPLILKEIHFQLLMSPIGGMLRNLLSVDSHASRIAKAIINIRQNFREPLVIAELANIAAMSPSSFHEHFKSITGTTPLQYQKDLRMIEARELLAAGARSVSSTSFEVGYESPTHFSRDYTRKFGYSPKHEATAAAATG
ncbi:MAG: AraC family transcriptional regulator [Rhizobiaceae bacterium]